MIRGTTPSITLSVIGFDDSLSMDQADVLWITFAQSGKEVFTVDKLSCSFNSGDITFTLTQEQTLSLSESDYVDIQIRALFGDRAIASEIVSTTVDKILKDGEI